MLRKKLLAIALGLASGSVALSASAGSGAPPISPDDIYSGPNPGTLMYADELLEDQDNNAPWHIDDNYHEGSLFAVTDDLRSGTVAEEAVYMRFELENAVFKEARDDDDLEVDNDEEINLLVGGAVNDDFVVYGITGDDPGFDPDDEFTFYLDDKLHGDDGGLEWLDKTKPIVVELCRYDENQDAIVPDADEEKAIDCRYWTLAEAKLGISFECKSRRNPVADVYAYKGNYMDFVGWDYGYHYKGHSGPKNFGKCTLASGAPGFADLNPAGEIAELDEYFTSETQVKIAGGELTGWADEFDAFLSLGEGKGDNGTYYGKGGYGRYNRCNTEDADLRFPVPIDDELYTDLDYLPLDQQMIMFNVCIDDRKGKPRHDPIPIVDGYTAMIIDNALTAGPYNQDIAGIDRNGIVLRAPFVTVHENAVQRAVLTNRGKIDAEYAFTCTSDDVDNSDVSYLDNAVGVLKANETACIEMKPRDGQPGVVAFSDGTKGACVITVAGRESHIDGAMTLWTDGSTDSTNMTPDEGYVETEPDILPLDRDE